jgi:regulator of sigma E protease
MGEDDEATDSPGNFNNKSVWARISVIAAGAVFNFILAFLMSVVIVGMTGYDSPVIGEVDPGFPAAEAGMQAGDRFVRVGDVALTDATAQEVSNAIGAYADGQEIPITVLRNGEELDFLITPLL